MTCPLKGRGSHYRMFSMEPQLYSMHARHVKTGSLDILNCIVACVIMQEAIQYVTIVAESQCQCLGKTLVM